MSTHRVGSQVAPIVLLLLSGCLDSLFYRTVDVCKGSGVLPEQCTTPRVISDSDASAVVTGTSCKIDADCVADQGHPHCNTTKGICAECTSNDQCNGSGVCLDSGICACSSDQQCASSAFGRACDTTTNHCVKCTSNTHCTDPANSVCDLTQKVCKPCTAGSNQGCAHMPAGRQVCTALAAGTAICGECTVQDESACTAKNQVCDPVTAACAVGKAPHSANRCEECISDSQCVESHHCLPMYFPDAATVRNDANGARRWFCLPDANAPTDCQAIRIYQVAKTATTRSGSQNRIYCHPLEQTTCEAIQIIDTPCTPSGTVPGAVCDAGANKSTIPCSVPPGNSSCPDAMTNPSQKVCGAPAKPYCTTF